MTDEEEPQSVADTSFCVVADNAKLRIADYATDTVPHTTWKMISVFDAPYCAYIVSFVFADMEQIAEHLQQDPCIWFAGK